MMTTTISRDTIENMENKWVAAAQLGPSFASRAAVHDTNGRFVAENYELMRENKFFSAAVPVELGGGGATHAEMCQVIREIAHHDGSTATP